MQKVCNKMIKQQIFFFFKEKAFSEKNPRSDSTSAADLLKDKFIKYWSCSVLHVLFQADGFSFFIFLV